MYDEEPAARCRPPEGLVAPVPRDEKGLAGPTPGQARGSRWRCTSHGLYVPAGTPLSVEQRIIEAAGRLPAGGAVTGWAACRMHGAAYHDGRSPDGRTERPVPLVVGRAVKLRAVPGVELHHCDPGDQVSIAGVPCVSPERAAYDATLFADDAREAVVALDMAYAGLITSKSRMLAYLERRRRVSGRVLDAFALSREGADSPQETRLRLIWVLDAGLSQPLVTHEVHGATGLLGIPDLFDEEAGLGVDYDGAEHRKRARHAHDTRRDDALRDHRVELLRVVGEDLRDVQQVVRRLRAARGRALFLPRGERPWHVVRPATTDELIALRELRREQAEGTRRALEGD